MRKKSRERVGGASEAFASGSLPRALTCQRSPPSAKESVFQASIVPRTIGDQSSSVVPLGRRYAQRALMAVESCKYGTAGVLQHRGQANLGNDRAFCLCTALPGFGPIERQDHGRRAF